MCQGCLDAVNRHYPYFTEAEICEILMSCTCYPCGTSEQVEEQLIELKEKTDGTLGGAIAFTNEELDREYNEYKRIERKKLQMESN